MYEIPRKGPKYFGTFAKNIIVGTGLAGLLAGGKSVTPAVIQYFNEMKQAVINGELSMLSAAPLLLCVGPALLCFAATYRTIRKVRHSPEEDY